LASFKNHELNKKTQHFFKTDINRARISLVVNLFGLDTGIQKAGVIFCCGCLTEALRYGFCNYRLPEKGGL
jgi:hypothetical protein